MEATKVTEASYNQNFRARNNWSITLANQGTKMTTDFLTYESGVVFLQGYTPHSLKPKQIFKLLCGCFEKASNFEKKLESADLLNGYERVNGILISIGNVPVLITKYDKDPDKVYEEWNKKKNLADAKD